MPPKKQKPTKKWSMYPSLHNDVSNLLREHNLFFQFYEKDDSRSCIDDYDTNIMGRFTCHNHACSARVWTSKQIAITIRRYSNNRYNARVYHQSCKSCETPSKPELDSSYAERVAYRIKKWCGVQMDAPLSQVGAMVHTGAIYVRGASRVIAAEWDLGFSKLVIKSKSKCR